MRICLKTSLSYFFCCQIFLSILTKMFTINPAQKCRATIATLGKIYKSHRNGSSLPSHFLLLDLFWRNYHVIIAALR